MLEDFDLGSGEGFNEPTSFNKNKDAYFTGERNFTTLKLSRVSSFENTRQKNLRSFKSRPLVVALVLKSEGL